MSEDLSSGRTAARRARLALLVARQLVDLPPGTTVVPDTESREIDLGPECPPADFIVQHLDLRIRLVLLLDVSDEQGLRESTVVGGAGRLLLHWPETAAVGLVANNEDLTCVLIDPFEGDVAIGVPSGGHLDPRATRPAVPVSEAIRAYLETHVPSWDAVPSISEQLLLPDPGEAVLQIAHDVMNAIVREGDRALIPEKKQAFMGISETDAQWASSIINRVLDGELDPDQLDQIIAERAGNP